jgi:predicted metal-dependent HD superfamily phosphohydrolase
MNISTLLNKYKIKADANMLLDMWCESHRGYHNLDHYMDINNMILNDYSKGLIDLKTCEKLCLTNLFHDIVYNPKRTDNEQKSAEFFLSLCLEKNSKDIIDINQAIIDTAKHKGTTPLSEKFNIYDMNIVERDYDSLIKWEEGIYEEFKFAGNTLYKKGRLDFLEGIVNKYPLNSSNLAKLIQHVKINY